MSKTQSILMKIRNLKEKNEELISQSANKDDYNFSSVGLSIDGEKIAFDNLDSVLTFNGKEYWSKELATKLVPDNKSVSRKMIVYTWAILLLRHLIYLICILMTVVLRG